MNDIRLEYWVEAIECALEDIGKEGILSKTEIKSMAQNLQNSAEQEDMAYGIEHIPNPLLSEIEKLKSEYNNKIIKLEETNLIFRKNVAKRLNVRHEDVYLDGENVVYDRKGL